MSAPFGPALVRDEIRHHDAHEGDPRADGEVELPCDQEQRRRRGQDADHRDGGEDVQPVVPVHEEGRLDPEEGDLGNKKEDECGKLGDLTPPALGDVPDGRGGAGRLARRERRHVARRVFRVTLHR
jgi:hypothetical protein